MDYSTYLPEIDVSGGVARVMNNEKLYFKLVGKFDGMKLKNDLTQAIEAKDTKAIIHVSHALRGTAANLGFGVVHKVAGEIEDLCKSEENYDHLIPAINKALDALEDAIGRLLKQA